MKHQFLLYLFLSGVLGVAFTSCSKTDKPPAPVTDIGGTTYRTVRIGDQVWMAENLRTVALTDGTLIQETADAVVWSDLSAPGLCWYNNDEATNSETYGALYNYYAVASGKLCPDGWHVPSKEEWLQLVEVAGDTLSGGGKLKEEGVSHWRTPNTGATNSFGFGALPAGLRYFEGTFNSINWFTSYWSSAEEAPDKAWYLSLYYSDAVAQLNRTLKKDGFSVRCVRN